MSHRKKKRVGSFAKEPLCRVLPKSEKKGNLCAGAKAIGTKTPLLSFFSRYYLDTATYMSFFFLLDVLRPVGYACVQRLISDRLGSTR